MTATEFNAVNRNVTVNVPVFSVKPGQAKGDAKNAFPSDLFVCIRDYDDPDDEDDEDDDGLFGFYRLNSHGKIETDEHQKPLTQWTFRLNQLNYAGETKLSLKQFHMAY